MRIIPLLFILLLGSLPASRAAGAADQVPIIPSGAGNRFELALDPKTSIKGLTPAQTRLFRAEITQLTDYLRSLPAVSAPPAPLCMRLTSWLELSVTDNKVAAATAGPYMPISFENGRCHRMTGSGVGVYINHDVNIFFNRYLRKSGERDYYLLPIRAVRGRLVEMEEGVLVVRQGKLPWRPVKRRSWLENEVALATEAVAEAERNWKIYLDTMTRLEGKPPKRTPGDDVMVQMVRDRLQRLRGEQARKGGADWICMDDTDQPSSRDDCGESRKLMERNPDYWDRAHPERIQLLDVHTDQPNLRVETEQRNAARMAVWHALSWTRLTDMVMP